MRILATLAAAAAAAGVLLTSAPASAQQCPPPTEPYSMPVGPVVVTLCVVRPPDCDPGSCDLAVSSRL